jgi:hypothetical protein
MNVVDHLIFSSHIDGDKKYPTETEINKPSITVTLHRIGFKSDSGAPYPHFEDVLEVIQKQLELSARDHGLTKVETDIYVSQ